jgi:hypothetical protein
MEPNRWKTTRVTRMKNFLKLTVNKNRMKMKNLKIKPEEGDRVLRKFNKQSLTLEVDLRELQFPTSA